jgi:hypothetical protein
MNHKALISDERSEGMSGRGSSLEGALLAINAENADGVLVEDASKVLTRARDVLKELHGFLEDYSPAWFTEGLHERAEKALYDLNRSISRRA